MKAHGRSKLPGTQIVPPGVGHDCNLHWLLGFYEKIHLKNLIITMTILSIVLQSSHVQTSAYLVKSLNIKKNNPLYSNIYLSYTLKKVNASSYPTAPG